MSGISIITCTGGRPEAFALLEGWISRQNYSGPVQWIVVDDCDPPTRMTFDPMQEVIRPTPLWRPGQITLGRNLSLALDRVRYEKIVFCEDDEIYLPRHLMIMDQMLENYQIAGEIPARYYNIRHRCFRVLDNKQHASLCQTGMRSDMIPRLKSLCMESSPFIDMQLWRSLKTEGVLFGTGVEQEDDTFPYWTPQVISTKGLPGRPGIGIGHRPQGDWKKDPALNQLREWIGDYADLYAGFAT